MITARFPNIIRHKDFTLTVANDLTRAPEFASIVQNNQNEFRFMPHTSQIATVRKAATEINGYAEQWLKRTAFFYFVIDQADKLVGCVGIKNKNPQHCAEISYWLDKTQCGKGYITNAVSLLEQQIFAAGYQRLEIWCNADNQASAMIPQRLGYHLDGVLRDAEYLLGTYHNVLIYSKLRTE